MAGARSPQGGGIRPVVRTSGFMGDRADVAASRFAAAVRRGRADVRADALDGRVAWRRFPLRRGEAGGCGAPPADLAAAYHAGGVFLLQSVRAAGLVLRADDPGLGDPPCRLY